MSLADIGQGLAATSVHELETYAASMESIHAVPIGG